MKLFFSQLFIFALYSCKICIAQNHTSTLSLISKEWYLSYEMDDRSVKEKSIDEKIYRFERNGEFYEKDGINIGKGFWKLNSDSSKICWLYKIYNQTTYKISECNNFRYTIEELTNDSLKLSILGRDGIVNYIFSNKKK